MVETVGLMYTEQGAKVVGTSGELWIDNRRRVEAGEGKSSLWWMKWKVLTPSWREATTVKKVIGFWCVIIPSSSNLQAQAGLTSRQMQGPLQCLGFPAPCHSHFLKGGWVLRNKRLLIRFHTPELWSSFLTPN
jgi:hypothetical protein